MKKIAWMTALLALCLAPQAPAANIEAKLMLSAGSISGLYSRYCTTLGDILARQTGIKPTVILTQGSVENLFNIQRKTYAATQNFYLGPSVPYAAVEAMQGESERFKGRPFKEIRVLWAMYPNMLHLVTAPGAGIKGPADLKGKRVATGALDSGTNAEAMMVLSAAGLKTSDLGMHLHLNYDKAADALNQGRLDAFFLSGGLPTPALTDLATTLAAKGTRMGLADIAPDSPVAKTIIAKMPGSITPGVIGKAVYNTQADCQTLAFWNLMVAHQDLPEDLAYLVTKTVMENLDSLRDKVPAAKDTSPANTARLVGGPLPFHPGALRYFKETGAVK